MIILYLIKKYFDWLDRILFILNIILIYLFIEKNENIYKYSNNYILISIIIYSYILYSWLIFLKKINKIITEYKVYYDIENNISNNNNDDINYLLKINDILKYDYTLESNPISDKIYIFLKNIYMKIFNQYGDKYNVLNDDEINFLKNLVKNDIYTFGKLRDSFNYILINFYYDYIFDNKINVSNEQHIFNTEYIVLNYNDYIKKLNLK